jgi:hypothetical protein
VSVIKVHIVRKRKADFWGDIVGTSPTHSQAGGSRIEEKLLADLYFLPLTFNLLPSTFHVRRSDEG